MTVRHSPSTGAGSPDVWGLYEPDTGSVQYVCACPETRKAALVDVVLNYDPASATTWTAAAEEVLALVEREDLKVEWVLDTHPHADHFMASAWLTECTGAPTAIGAKVREIAGLWRGLYNMPDAFDPDIAFDRLFAEGDRFRIGKLDVEVWLSPGHTLGSITYLAGDAAFVHDTLMYPDAGSSRADFPGADVHQLWDSVQRILSLPAGTRCFVGHDYCKGGREPRWEATVAEHKRDNVHLKDGVSRETFIRTRTERDRTLSPPDRMLAALQVNLRGGRLPEPEADGERYLRIPLNRLERKTS